jgi:hypothetical protein
MNVKTFMLAAGVAFGTFGIANAQTAEQQVIINAQIAAVSATCAATPATCLDAVNAALAALSAAGLTGAEFDSALGRVGTAVLEIGLSLPRASQEQMAGAFFALRNAATFGSPINVAFAEIASSFSRNELEGIRAFLPSPN